MLSRLRCFWSEFLAKCCNNARYALEVRNGMYVAPSRARQQGAYGLINGVPDFKNQQPPWTEYGSGMWYQALVDLKAGFAAPKRDSRFEVADLTLHRLG